MFGTKTLSEIRAELRAKGVDLTEFHKKLTAPIRRPATPEEIEAAEIRLGELLEELAQQTNHRKTL